MSGNTTADPCALWPVLERQDMVRALFADASRPDSNAHRMMQEFHEVVSGQNYMDVVAALTGLLTSLVMQTTWDGDPAVPMQTLERLVRDQIEMNPMNDPAFAGHVGHA